MARTFVALELKDAAIKEAIRSLQRELLAPGVRAKAVEAENLHMTLKFLGEVPDSSIEGIASSLRDIQVPPFTIHFRGVGVFPSPSRIHVVWLGAVEGAEEVRRLSTMVNERLTAFGRPEDFKAHLTILRVKEGTDVSVLASGIERLKGFDGGTSKFSEFQLKKSVLTPSGPIYSDLAVFPLR